MVGVGMTEALGTSRRDESWEWVHMMSMGEGGRRKREIGRAAHPSHCTKHGLVKRLWGTPLKKNILLKVQEHDWPAHLPLSYSPHELPWVHNKSVQWWITYYFSHTRTRTHAMICVHLWRLKFKTPTSSRGRLSDVSPNPNALLFSYDTKPGTATGSER